MILIKARTVRRVDRVPVYELEDGELRPVLDPETGKVQIAELERLVPEGLEDRAPGAYVTLGEPKEGATQLRLVPEDEVPEGAVRAGPGDAPPRFDLPKTHPAYGARVLAAGVSGWEGFYTVGEGGRPVRCDARGVPLPLEPGVPGEPAEPGELEIGREPR